VPIRVVPGEQGIIAVCGDRENIDRRGRLAVTWVGPDDLLVLLGIEDARTSRPAPSPQRRRR